MSAAPALRPAGRLVLGLLVAALAFLLAAAPFRLRELSAPCQGARCDLDRAVLSPAAAAVLTGWGVTLEQYAWWQTLSAGLLYGVGGLLALVLLRQPALDRMKLLLALNLSVGGFGFASISLNALPPAAPWTLLPVSGLLYTGYVTFIVIFYVFPDGRWVPGWTRWLALALAVTEALYTLSTASAVVSGRPLYAGSWLDLLDNIVWVGSFAAVLAAQVYRYVRVAGPVERAQTHWVLYGLAVSLSILLGFIVGGRVLGVMADPRYQLLFALVTTWLPLPLLATLGIAILRHRLFDIDLLIRRTLVYSALTALLTSLYFGLVIILQAAVTSLGGPRSEWVTVASTLAVAALVAPLRARVQAFIDRRFYRRKYDAAQTLAAFAAVARDETDLNVLTGKLAGVVQDAMEPESVTIWLKHP